MAQKGANWGEPPWRIDSAPQNRPLPGEVDFAIVGGGFTGLAAAAWLRQLAPEKTVAVLEAERIGSGASGRTGGLALAETAAGDLPGLGNVLAGFRDILQTLEVDCDLSLRGVWEIGRRNGRADSPLGWNDSGTLRVVNEVPGGTMDPGKLVAGLARAAGRLGAILREQAPVQSVEFGKRLTLKLPRGELRAGGVLFATNARSLELSGLDGRVTAKFTLAVATAPPKEAVLEAIGLAERKGFYTLDLPYLWGRVLSDNGIIFGAGLVDVSNEGDLARLDVASGRPAELLRNLERRVRGLHPALRPVEFTHRWGGPILFGNGWRPFFARHPRSPNALVLGGYSGQGVTLSVYLGCWAAEVLLGRKEPPPWGAIA